MLLPLSLAENLFPAPAREGVREKSGSKLPLCSADL
jgi:hypothetical protein